MNTLVAVQLSESKRPILVEGELENILQDNIALYEGDKVTKYEKSIAYLTSHRLIILDQDNKLPPLGLHFSKVADIDADSGGFIKGSQKIKIALLGRDMPYLKLSFRSGNRDNFLAKFKSVLKSRSWEKVVEQKQKEIFATSKAGITGIIRTTETKSKETDKTLQQAFTDINALMEKAKDMVGLAEKIQAILSKENSGNEADNELRSVLISIGIQSPVTKDSAGSLYHSQLSRQLADWLHKPLERLGGMVTLPDLYCAFNRARGTEMISPDDLYRACVLFEELHLPVRLRRFDSGVLVVQSMSQTDDAIAKQITDLIRLDGPQTAFDVARTKNISIAFATDQLLTAERLGAVCRDETYEGVVFYLNFFSDVNLVKLYLKS